MVLALALVTAVVAVVDWWSALQGRREVERVAKPLTMVGLIAVAEAAGAGAHAAGVLLLVALFLGMVGDVMLLGDTAERFLAGVGAFLVGHLAYVACFLVLGLSHPSWSWVCVVALFGMLVVTRDVVPSTFRLGGARVAVPVAAYSLVIGAMLVVGWLTGLPLVAAGATIFVVSDSIIGLSLAKRGFAGPSGAAHAAVMVTYHVGQALIAAGVLHALA